MSPTLRVRRVPIGVRLDGTNDVDGVAFDGEFGRSTPVADHRATSFVHRFLWLRPETIVVGPRLTFGPYRTGVGTARDWAVLDLQGSVLGRSRDPLDLWSAWGDAVIG